VAKQLLWCRESGKRGLVGCPTGETGSERSGGERRPFRLQPLDQVAASR
jgi:hypothetical protein